jgi:hypothetical protein
MSKPVGLQDQTFQVRFGYPEIMSSILISDIEILIAFLFAFFFTIFVFYAVEYAMLVECKYGFLRLPNN